MNTTFLLLCAILVYSLLFVGVFSAPNALGKNGWELHFKNIQGAPEEFPNHLLPDPAKSAVDSDTSKIRFNLLQNAFGKYFYETKFPVDAGDVENALFRMHFLSNLPAEKVTVFVKKPSASEFERVTDAPSISWFGMSELSGVPSFTYEFENPEMGEWSLRVESDAAPVKTQSVDFPTLNLHDFILLLENDSPYKISSHLQSYRLTAGKFIGLASKLYDERNYHQTLRQLRGLDNSASAEDIFDTDMDLPAPVGLVEPFDGAFDFEMDVVYPNGKEVVIKMHSSTANNGEYFGSVTADQPGKYSAEVKLSAVTPEGHKLIRTTHHIFVVVPEDEELNFHSTAHAVFNPADKMLTMHIPLSSRSIRGVLGKQVKAYTEIWGTKDNGSEGAIAFASGMSIVDLFGVDGIPADETTASISLKVHADWISRSDVDMNGKFILKNLFIQDATNSIPLAESESVELIISQEQRSVLTTYLSLTPNNGLVSEEMRMGNRPIKYTQAYRSAMNSGHKLVLTHGYCASGNPFSTAKFTNFVEFDDPKKNRNNDEFAQLLGAFGDQYSSFSVVSHSQGGIAALHLLSFYWSSLDLNVERSDDKFRWIQSVGSPYQGTSLAGWGDAGKNFGVGCGTNTDLTPEGAQLWLTGIPADARKHVYYYYTTYKDWSWCSMPVQAVLSWQNDGTTEAKRAPLPGGISIGTKKGFCHTDGMKYPAQTKDDANNAILNSRAARL